MECGFCGYEKMTWLQNFGVHSMMQTDVSSFVSSCNHRARLLMTMSFLVLEEYSSETLTVLSLKEELGA